MFRHVLLTLLLTMLILGLLASVARAEWIGNIQIHEESPAYLGHGSRVEVSFDYEVTNPEGMRAQAYPWCAADTYPDFTWSGCPPLHGSGSYTLWFTLNTGSLDIDHVKLRSWTAVSGTDLFELDLPVQFFFRDHGVHALSPSHGQPSWLALGEHLQIDFEAMTDLPTGAYVFMRPFTGGTLTPGYGASPASSIPDGGGVGTQHFFFDDDADVDAIRVQMTNPSQTLLLRQFFVPVDYHWRAHGVSNVVLDPPPPAYLPFEMHVTAEFDYHSSFAGDLGMWARGALDGVLLNPQWFQGSTAMPTPTGHTTRWFTVPSPDAAQSNQLRLQVNAWQGSNLFLEPVPGEYHFGDHGIYNIQFHPTSTAILDHDSNVDVTFDYSTNSPGDVRIFLYPLVNGALPPLYNGSGSPNYPSGSGSGSYWFRLPAHDLEVDQVLFRMWDVASEESLLQFRVDTQLFWGSQFYIVDTPAVPQRRLVLDQNVPNPFNPSTEISFSLPNEGVAKLSIFDPRGRHVVDLWNGSAPAGPTTVRWDGRDTQGRALASGVYFYQVEAGGVKESRRMVLLR